MSEEILRVEGAKKHYEVKKTFGEDKLVKALDGVSFSLQRQKTLAIVGESGCGKSTLAKFLMQIETPTAGNYSINGRDVKELPKKEFLQQIQMIFQDPYSSINPRKKAWQIIAEPLFVNTDLPRSECRNKAIEMMEVVGLRPELADRFPHMFSGGQRQRIGIARALILHPKILICDEPVSALDVSIQAQVINLMIDLQDDLGVSYLFISHDLSVVKHIADQILVMYLGKVVEYGDYDKVFSNPQHPYTQALLASTPQVSTDQHGFQAISGELPSPLDPPSGCAFHKRCPHSTPECETQVPELVDFQGRKAACHHLGNLK